MPLSLFSRLTGSRVDGNGVVDGTTELCFLSLYQVIHDILLIIYDIPGRVTDSLVSCGKPVVFRSSLGVPMMVSTMRKLSR